MQTVALQPANTPVIPDGMPSGPPVEAAPGEQSFATAVAAAMGESSHSIAGPNRISAAPDGAPPAEKSDDDRKGDVNANNLAAVLIPVLPIFSEIIPATDFAQAVFPDAARGLPEAASTTVASTEFKSVGGDSAPASLVSLPQSNAGRAFEGWFAFQGSAVGDAANPGAGSVATDPIAEPKEHTSLAATAGLASAVQPAYGSAPSPQESQPSGLESDTHSPSCDSPKAAEPAPRVTLAVATAILPTAPTDGADAGRNMTRDAAPVLAFAAVKGNRDLLSEKSPGKNGAQDLPARVTDPENISQSPGQPVVSTIAAAEVHSLASLPNTLDTETSDAVLNPSAGPGKSQKASPAIGERRDDSEAESLPAKAFDSSTIQLSVKDSVTNAVLQMSGHEPQAGTTTPLATPAPVVSAGGHGSNQAEAPTVAPRLAPAEAPASLPVTGTVNTARIVDIVGQSEMHLGLRTSSFGNVEVHTVIRDAQVGLAVGSERGDLKTYLAAEVPSLQTNLRQQSLELTPVRFLGQSSALSAGLSGGSDPQSHGFPYKQASFLPMNEPSSGNLPEVEIGTATRPGLSVHV